MAIHLHTFDKDLQNAKIDERNICKEKLRLCVIETCAIETHILMKQISCSSKGPKHKHIQGAKFLY